MWIQPPERTEFLQRLAALQQEIENDPRVNLKAPERLSSPDPLIVEAKQGLAENEKYIHEGLVGSKRGQLDVAVSPANALRALRFLDTFVKAWKARGHSITNRNDESYAAYGQEEILIKFRERSKRVQKPDRSYTEKEPTGLLYFKAGYFREKEWIDGKQSVEEQLPKILAWLELTGQLEAAERAERERRHTAERVEAAKAQAIIQQKKEEEADFQALLQEGERWRQARDLKDYLQAVEAKANQENKVTEAFTNWLVWAKSKAEEHDPLNKKIS